LLSSLNSTPWNLWVCSPLKMSKSSRRKSHTGNITSRLSTQLSKSGTKLKATGRDFNLSFVLPKISEHNFQMIPGDSKQLTTNSEK
jgi:hypothetical protein